MHPILLAEKANRLCLTSQLRSVHSGGSIEEDSEVVLSLLGRTTIIHQGHLHRWVGWHLYHLPSRWPGHRANRPHPQLARSLSMRPAKIQAVIGHYNPSPCLEVLGVDVESSSVLSTA